MFAKQVHAQAHAISALNDVRRAAAHCRSLPELIAQVNHMAAQRCRSIGLAPDEVCDALEAATDEFALEQEVLAEEDARHA